ncbi:MAG: hypothetical protein SFZ03_07465 [Candidatus Melainabacteria bacterium]|nr:hypothetical protein [Candidatus Melainabacteria bacterium]
MMLTLRASAVASTQAHTTASSLTAPAVDTTRQKAPFVGDTVSFRGQVDFAEPTPMPENPTPGQRLFQAILDLNLPAAQQAVTDGASVLKLKDHDGDETHALGEAINRLEIDTDPKGRNTKAMIRFVLDTAKAEAENPTVYKQWLNEKDGYGEPPLVDALMANMPLPGVLKLIKEGASLKEARSVTELDDETPPHTVENNVFQLLAHIEDRPLATLVLGVVNRFLPASERVDVNEKIHFGEESAPETPFSAAWGNRDLATMAALRLIGAKPTLDTDLLAVYKEMDTPPNVALFNDGSLQGWLQTQAARILTVGADFNATSGKNPFAVAEENAPKPTTTPE